MKGMRVAGVRTIEEANAYLENEYLPWWNQTLTVKPAEAADAHRPLGKEHDLAAILSHVEPRQVTNDYTVRYRGKVYQIDRPDIRAGMRRAIGAGRAAIGRDHRRAVPGPICARAPLRTATARVAVHQNQRGQTPVPNRQGQTQKRLDEEFLDSVWSLSAAGRRGV